MLSSIQLYNIFHHDMGDPLHNVVYYNEVLTTLCISGSAEDEKSPEFFLQPSKSILSEKDV